MVAKETDTDELVPNQNYNMAAGVVSSESIHLIQQAVVCMVDPFPGNDKSNDSSWSIMPFW